MKSRVTITLDPGVLEQARTEARLRGISLSALIEDRLKQVLQHSLKPSLSFTKKWAGQLTVRQDNQDALLNALKTRFRLEP
jgi:Family of unknown function (DUF6364)